MKKISNEVSRVLKFNHFLSAGFTLLELVVVFSIMAILSTIGIASFVSYSNSQSVQNAASNLANTLNLAKAKSAAQVKPSTYCLQASVLNGYGVDVSTTANTQGYYTYNMYVVCNGIKFAIGQPSYLPTGIQVEAYPQITTTNSVFFPVITNGVVGSGNIGLSGNKYSEFVCISTTGIITQQTSECTYGTPAPTSTPAPSSTSTPTPTPAPTSTPTPAPTSSSSPTPTPYAGPYYVSTTGSDSNPGTLAAPFATVNKADSVVVPGSVVFVEPGTYNQYVKTSTSGTSSLPISYISQTVGAAQIVNSGATSNNGATWNNVGNYINITGFDISGGQRLGILNYGTNVTIQQNHVHDLAVGYCQSSGGAGIDSSDSLTSVGNTVINRNLVNNVGPKPCSYVHGIYVQRSNEQVTNNIIVNNGGLGVACTHSCTASIISNNDILNNGYGIRVGWSSTNPGNTSNMIVSNNIIAYSALNPAIYESSTPGTIGTGNQYLNNLFYSNASDSCSLYNGDICKNTIVANPQFVGYQPNGSGNYQVYSISPAVNSGTSTGAPGMDYAGNSRPQGSGYDRGAYEQ